MEEVKHSKSIRFQRNEPRKKKVELDGETFVVVIRIVCFEALYFISSLFFFLQKIYKII